MYGTYANWRCGTKTHETKGQATTAHIARAREVTHCTLIPVAVRTVLHANTGSVQGAQINANGEIGTIYGDDPDHSRGRERLQRKRENLRENLSCCKRLT